MSGQARVRPRHPNPPVRGRWISHWNPEDETFWETTGRRVARRNLVFSIAAQHVGFSVWLLWSVVVVSLPAAGFDFPTDQLLWLVATPNLVGALMRLPYTAAVARFGGRNWTTASAALLVLPVGLTAWCLTNPATPYWLFLVAAATAGLGGGNFASSMANISYFYPDRAKGLALGVNAAGGNLGVAVVQLLTPLVVGVGVLGTAQANGLWLHNAPLLWLLPVLVATGCAWLFMDNLSVSRASLREQSAGLRSKHTWIVSVLYLGTFGSFIGYSAAFPLLAAREFPALNGVALAFLGPLVGSLSRPLGGWLSDRVGGARVTGWNFAGMAGSALVVLVALDRHSYPLFLAAFLALFVTSGIGNGSTYRMIPAIFRAEAQRAARTDPSRPAETYLARGRLHSAVAIGISSAVGAFGGFVIPPGFGVSISLSGSIAPALMLFVTGYAVFAAATWWFYLRRRVLVARIPSLAYASI